MEYYCPSYKVSTVAIIVYPIWFWIGTFHALIYCTTLILEKLFVDCGSTIIGQLGMFIWITYSKQSISAWILDTRLKPLLFPIHCELQSITRERHKSSRNNVPHPGWSDANANYMMVLWIKHKQLVIWQDLLWIHGWAHASPSLNTLGKKTSIAALLFKKKKKAEGQGVLLLNLGSLGLWGRVMMAIRLT